MSQAGPSSPPQKENQYPHSPEANRSNPPSMQVSDVVDTSNLVTKDDLQTHFKNFETLLTQFQANMVATMPLQSAQRILQFPASNHQQAAQGIQSVSVSNQPVAPSVLGLAPQDPFASSFALPQACSNIAHPGGPGVLPVSVAGFDWHVSSR